MADAQIGTILVRNRLVDPQVIERVLTEQENTDQRLVSMLVAQAHLDPDDAATALAEQLGYPAALTRHLELRTATLAKAISPAICREWAVIPITRTPDRALVVVARDPSPALLDLLQRETGCAIELAVAPAILVERLIKVAYGGPPKRISPSPAARPLHTPRGKTVSALLVAQPAAKPAAPRAKSDSVGDEWGAGTALGIPPPRPPARAPTDEIAPLPRPPVVASTEVRPQAVVAKHAIAAMGLPSMRRTNSPTLVRARIPSLAPTPTAPPAGDGGAVPDKNENKDSKR